MLGLLKRLGRMVDHPAEPLLAYTAEEGAPFERVVFTSNKRVMISAGDGGRTLRIHERFREAPPEVQRAVGALYGRSRKRREQARAVIRRFLAEQPQEPPRARVRKRRPGDADVLVRLEREFERVNTAHFGGRLPAVPLHLSSRMRRRNGHFSTHPLEIVISRRLCEDAAAGEAERTLRHEMIHLWQHEQGQRPGHGADFRRWAGRLSIYPRATRVVDWGAEC